MTISIRALNPDDWQILKTMRLLALKLHHGTFFSNYEQAKDENDDVWRETLNAQGKCVFGLFDDKKLIGITAVFTFREDPTGQTGMFAYSFILPEYRGLGLSKLFYEARLNWALNHLPFKKLFIGHREGNKASQRAMLAHGFQFIDKTKILWPDGTEDYEYKYELDLEKLRRSQQ